MIEERKAASGHERAHPAAVARRRRGRRLVDYEVEVVTGMVVLDAVLEVQRSQAQDLAVRWNCKAAKCGCCGAEVNGLPR